MGILTKIFGGTKRQDGSGGSTSLEAFIMKVDRDIFPVIGRGVVVTGTVEDGTISSGDKVCFTSKTGNRIVCGADVQAGGEGKGSSQTASAGMLISLLIEGADYRDIEEGTVISGSMKDEG